MTKLNQLALQSTAQSILGATFVIALAAFIRDIEFARYIAPPILVATFSTMIFSSTKEAYLSGQSDNKSDHLNSEGKHTPKK